MSPAWTHQHYGPSRGCSQIDYVLSPSSLPSSSSILYSLDCATDHKPVTCTVNAPLPRPARVYRKSVKGWKPCIEADAQSFRLHLNSIEEGANTSRIQHVLMDAVAATPASSRAKQRGGPRFEEPPGVLEARAELFNCPSPEARSCWSKQLYRRKRKWLNYVARRRFDLDGSRVPRIDPFSRSKTRVLYGAVGVPCYDVTQWGGYRRTLLPKPLFFDSGNFPRATSSAGHLGECLFRCSA